MVLSRSPAETSVYTCTNGSQTCHVCMACIWVYACVHVLTKHSVSVSFATALHTDNRCLPEPLLSSVGLRCMIKLCLHFTYNMYMECMRRISDYCFDRPNASRARCCLGRPLGCLFACACTNFLYTGRPVSMLLTSNSLAVHFVCTRFFCFLFSLARSLGLILSLSLVLCGYCASLTTAYRTHAKYSIHAYTDRQRYNIHCKILHDAAIVVLFHIFGMAQFSSVYITCCFVRARVWVCVWGVFFFWESVFRIHTRAYKHTQWQITHNHTITHPHP